MWYIATSASVVSGQDVVEVLTGDDVSSISSGSALIFEDGSPVEVLEAYETTEGRFIKLASNWPYTTKSAQPLLVYPTSSGLAEATAALKLYLDNIQVASTIEAQTGTNDTKIMTALKTKQAIDFNTGTAATKDVTTSPTDTTAGRLLKVGDFGISGNTAPPFSNTLNYDSDEVYSGIHRITNASQITLPEGVSTFGILDVSRYGSSDLVQVYTPITQDRRLFRRIQGDIVNDWVEMYHSGNTNFNEFGGLSTGGIMKGVATLATSAMFEFQLSSNVTPTGITVESGSTFEIRNPAGGIKLDGITDINMHPSSTNRLLRIDITGLSGLVVNEPLILRNSTPTSKITVNY